MARFAHADTATPAPTADPTIDIQVTARRWSEPLQAVPGSISVVSSAMVQAAGVQSVREANYGVPNLTLPDFSARWLSFPYIRGIGSGRNSPAVTTIIDGVPQLSYVTANQELLDVGRIEFLRGPQGSMYGRNALGGVVNVTPAQPSEELSARVTAGFGDYNLRDVRATVGGPVGKELGGSLSLGYNARDGYTTNDITGHSLDTREALFNSAQLAWAPAGPWTMRFSVTGERDRDGDYGLGDLTALRANPHHVAHDFEGYNNRDLAQPVFTAVRKGHAFDLTSITAWQWWRISDLSDTDFSALDLLRRGTREEQQAWLEEVRVSAPAETPLALGAHTSVRWLAGALAFTSRDTQDQFTHYSATFAQGLGVPFGFTQHDTALLRNTGVSPYGQVNLSFYQRLDLTLGLRYDFEHKTADLNGYSDPALQPGTPVAAARDYHQTSPQVSLAYHLTPALLCYATAAKGYKSGGFNAPAPAGKTAYNEELSQNYEAGVKTAWLRNRVTVNACLFHTAWDDMQLDVPAAQPGVFYIDNAGRATSNGGEVEVTARPLTGCDLFGGVGLLDTTFKPGSQSGGTDVSGKELPFAPRTTWRVGAQLAHTAPGGIHQFARLEVLGTGKFFYDAANGASQANYALTNVRLGAEKGRVRLEGWVKNLFNTKYVPVAFPAPLPTLPSGYAGESGAPRTIGLTVTYAMP